MSLTQRMTKKRQSETAGGNRRERIKMPTNNKGSPRRGVTPNQGMTRLMAQQCLKDQSLTSYSNQILMAHIERASKGNYTELGDPQ